MSRFRPVVFSASTKHIPGGANSHLCWQQRELQCLGQYEATAARNDSKWPVVSRTRTSAHLPWEKTNYFLLGPKTLGLPLCFR